MFSLRLKPNTKKAFGALLLVVVLCAPVSNTFTAKKADAQLFGGGGRIVQDIQNTLTNTLQTIAAESLAQKDLVLDGIFYNIAQKALQQLTGSILSFINTGGQNVRGESDGRPTFLSDYSDLMDEIAFETGSELIYGEALDSMCTSFQLDVRIALAAQLQADLEGPKAKIQKQVACTLDESVVDVGAFFTGTFSAGGLAALWETVLNPQNAPLVGKPIAKAAIYKAIAEEQEEKKKDLDYNNGFSSLKTCTNITTPTGSERKCVNTTPGIVLQGRMSSALDAPMESLLNADEFDEVIGSLFGNLATEAITGINGLLGLSDRTHGAGGNQTYFDAIRNDPTNGATNSQTSDNPIGRALATETRVGTAEIGIVNAISNLTRCSPDVVLPPELRGVLTEFTPKVIATGEVVVQLSDMALAYANSTSAADKGRLLSRLEAMRTDGKLSGLPIALEYEQFLNVDLKNYITAFKADTNYVEVSCTAPLTS